MTLASYRLSAINSLAKSCLDGMVCRTICCICSVVPTNPWWSYKSMTCVSCFGSILPRENTEKHGNIPALKCHSVAFNHPNSKFSITQFALFEYLHWFVGTTVAKLAHPHLSPQRVWLPINLQVLRVYWHFLGHHDI